MFGDRIDRQRSEPEYRRNQNANDAANDPSSAITFNRLHDCGCVHGSAPTVAPVTIIDGTPGDWLPF
jgi:hypothetical protein